MTPYAKTLSFSLFPPLLFGLLAIVVWQWIVWFFDIQPFLLPTPGGVAKAFVADFDDFANAAKFTSSAALCGLTASSLVGILIGTVFSQSDWVRKGGYPYAIYLQTAPIVAVAPLLVAWIGEGFVTIVVVVFIISLFPIITNTTDGLLAVPRELHELFRLNKANRWQTLWQLQLPHATPRILTGIKIASAMVVLGATVGEYFVGQFSDDNTGLGHVIFQANAQMRTDRLFAATIICTVLSVCIFSTVAFIGRHLVRWSDG